MKIIFIKICKAKYLLSIFLLILGLFVFKENIFALNIENVISTDTGLFEGQKYDGTPFEGPMDGDAYNSIMKTLSKYENSDKDFEKEAYDYFCHSDNFVSVYHLFRDETNLDEYGGYVTTYFWSSENMQIDRFQFYSDDDFYQNILWKKVTTKYENFKLGYITYHYNQGDVSCYIRICDVQSNGSLFLYNDMYYKYYQYFGFNSTVPIDFYDSNHLDSNSTVKPNIDEIDFSKLVNVTYKKVRYKDKQNSVEFTVDLDKSLVDDYVVYVTVINKFLNGNDENKYTDGYVIHGDYIYKDLIIIDFECTPGVPFYLLTDEPTEKVPLQVDVQVLRKSDFKRGYMKQFQVLVCNIGNYTDVYKEETTTNDGNSNVDFDNIPSLNNNTYLGNMWNSDQNVVDALKDFFANSYDFLDCISYFFSCLPNWLVYPFIFLIGFLVILAVFKFVRGG